MSELGELVQQWLSACGVDPSDPHLADTPERVARAWHDDLLSGIGRDPAALLVPRFPAEGYTGSVLVGPIPIASLCAHHLLPFWGDAWVGYLPGATVVGLSKFVRVVDCLARRPQVQERLTHQIVEIVENTLAPRAVGVMIRAEHACMRIRGVRTPATTSTVACAGAWTASEWLALVTAHGLD